MRFSAINASAECDASGRESKWGAAGSNLLSMAFPKKGYSRDQPTKLLLRSQDLLMTSNGAVGERGPRGTAGLLTGPSAISFTESNVSPGREKQGATMVQ